ncbi:MAG: heavy metal translocating P-type ATPase metal-binding domain-containing protein [Tunicatimonas sp.]|uniref:heavy metal translocating P-type ATPase n=1 Tax=Tunicatimonas sp. TaxID=1940096 RepID=UPI003C7872E3
MSNLSVAGPILVAPPACFHCGEDCTDKVVVQDNKNFCCQGCQTVHDILCNSGLDSYYTLENTPGASQKKSSASTQWASLDLPEVQTSLIDFQEGEISRVTLFLPTIHCSACIWLLERLPQFNANIVQARVHFLKKEVNITFRHSSLSLRSLVELLQSVGYTPDISLATSAKPKPNKRNNLILKIAIAGFCFGNVMLLSLPDYLDADFSLSPTYRTFFSYLTLLLSLPVFFYSASSYFSGAIKGLRHRLLTLDVPIVLGLLTLFGRSSYEVFTQTGTGYFDSLTGLVFFLLIGKWYQNKTYQALSYDRDYASYFPIAVTRLVNQQEVTTPLKDIQVGDQLLIRHQELIPADAILLRGEARIDYSFVTGESEPVEKVSGDYLYAGGKQQGGPLTVELRKPVANSYLTDLWNQDVFTQPLKGSLSPLANRVGQYFTWVILAISVATAAYWYGQDSSMIVKAVTSVLIVACPCALALSIPFTFGHAQRLLGKHGLYLKNTETLERLASIDHIVFDKTGTITQAQPSEIPFVGEPLSTEEQSWVRTIARTSTHPLSQAIYRSLPDHLPLLPITHFHEQAGQGITAKVEGVEIRIGSAAWVGNSSQTDTNVTQVYIRIGDQIRGYYRFANHYRPGFTSLMQQLRHKYTTHLLSGDQDRERANLAPYFQELHFQQSPMNKLEYLKTLEEDGKHPLMVGDGLNDAGALKQSHVGIAVADNVYQFSPACDAILEANQLLHLGSFLRFSRVSMRIVKWAFVLSFLYNLVGLSFAISGLLTPLIAAVLMPLSSVTVVGFITLAVNGWGKTMLRP